MPATSPVKLPDYSVFLEDAANLKNEEEQWAARAFYKKNADALMDFMYQVDECQILEIGCGTGWIPFEMNQRMVKRGRPFSLGYVGVDNNVGCLFLALQKNTNVAFIRSDIRQLLPNYTAPIVVCFAVLKHFGLHEWDAVFRSVVNRGRHALFTMQIADADKDDGTEYHHSWITEEHLRRAVEEAGHKILRTEVWGVAENGAGEEWLVWTKRK